MYIYIYICMVQCPYSAAPHTHIPTQQTIVSATVALRYPTQNKVTDMRRCDHRIGRQSTPIN